MTSRTVDIHCKSCWRYCYSVLDVSDDDSKYVCKSCAAPKKTELFPPDIKPVHVGFYETTFADGGWVYEIRVWWDGRHWRDSETGWCLVDQDVSWRGLTTEQTI